MKARKETLIFRVIKIVKINTQFLVSSIIYVFAIGKRSWKVLYSFNSDMYSLANLQRHFPSEWRGKMLIFWMDIKNFGFIVRKTRFDFKFKIKFSLIFRLGNQVTRYILMIIKYTQKTPFCKFFVIQ